MVDTGYDVATVMVELLAGTGNKLTDYQVTLSACDWKQETQPYKNTAGTTSIDRGCARVTVQT